MCVNSGRGRNGKSLCCSYVAGKYIDTFIKLDVIKLEPKNHRISELLSMLWINVNENFQDSTAIIYQ